ncbi:uncharacterized protein LOC133485018 [Phyllopteryx taeniolatus]|uniref:uncharacterized protein LOC133485018 n=1 Tax=Phyllopteryx taeniolatus TaxID=161469 RepID=UPI002AD55132|nr:uncharacterized protein LOC133485018 [Phyllopteryx taeniolatus]
MRRFFHVQRDEDYSQIQYLTAKCTHLARDKAVSDREFLLSREREKKLQNDFQAVAAQLFHLEKSNVELRRTQDQLIGTIQQQQELVEWLQQRVVFLAGETERDAELLRQVCSELLCLQSSEAQLEGLAEELHAKALLQQRREAESLGAELHPEDHRGEALTDGLQADLEIKTAELDQLRDANKKMAAELMDLRFAHEEQVRALRWENDSGARKLQETLEQFEWLCQQQRYWMACVKSFKDCFMGERENLLQQVRTLERKAKQWKKSNDHRRRSHCLLQDYDCSNRQGVLSTDTKNLVED